MTRSPRERAIQKTQIRKQQETLLLDLLTVVDALDHAADHWHRADELYGAAAESHDATSGKPSLFQSLSSIIRRLQHWLKQLGVLLGSAARRKGTQRKGDRPSGFSDTGAGASPRVGAEEPSLAEVITSARDGIDIIHESMMTMLDKHQVVPIPTTGHPFDPTYMSALGQQPNGQVPPNTVIQEVVRGYRWQDRVLREAQVIVAVSPAAESQSPVQ